MSLLLADIASGNTDSADVLFLLAVIVFALDVVLVILAGLARARPADHPGATARDLWWWRPLLVPLGLGLVALALLEL